VDAGVGAAGALGKDGFAGEVVEGLSEGPLDGREAGLDLPAVEAGAVVAEDEFPVGHRVVVEGYQFGYGWRWLLVFPTHAQKRA